MKSRDRVLFAFPLLLGLMALAVAGTLFLNTRDFESSYVAGEKRSILVEAETMADVLRPLLEAGDVEQAVAYCQKPRKNALRATLVRSDGKVLADTDVDAVLLDNHASREEIDLALSGSPNVVARYSATENARMVYCAAPVFVGERPEFVLRLAVRNREMDAMIAGAERSTWLALILGVAVALSVSLYILIRVRRPIAQLQESALKISAGNLDERISIPRKGLVRELAVAVSRMKEQLKRRLDQITAERNTREFLFSTLSEAVLLFSENGDATFFNNAARTIFGIEPEAGKFNLARCASAELVRLANRAFQEGTPFEAEISLEGGNASSPRALFAKGGIVHHDGKRSLLLAVTDLTNLRRLESFRSDFVANVSHEIKTPLTGILGAVESLETGALADPPMAQKFLDILSKQAQRLNALVQDVLSLASIERQQISTERREMLPFRLDAAVENAVNLCLPEAEAAKITLEITRLDPVSLSGDSHLVEQAVLNLVGNAIKHSGSARVEISLEKEEKENAPAKAVIAVRDFGTGIAPEHCERLFERFYSADKAHSRAHGGTGLGLAIVKHIARLHGGNATVESTPGKGSLFRIFLPLK